MKEQNSFKKKVFQNGSYSIFICIAMVAIIIVVNLLINILPSQITNVDFSEQALFSISDKTEKLLKNLNKDVTIYHIAQPGEEDPVIEEMLDKYEDLSEHIKVEQVDTAVNPMFAKQYTQDGIDDNSLVVESELRYQVIANDSINVVNTVTYEEGYSYEYETFEGESALTSAIDYVTSDVLPVVYTLTGHSEVPLGDKLLSYLKNENIEIVDLSLAVSGAIPEDCACLIINAPLKDISADEQEIITDYVDAGGHLLYVKNIYSDMSTRMDEVVEYFGISFDSSMVFELDSDYKHPEDDSFFPVMESHVITDPLIENKVSSRISSPRRIIVDEENGLVEITKLLTTSENGCAIPLIDEEGQENEYGTMTVAVAAEGPERVSGKETKVVVIAADTFLEEEINEYVSDGNYDFVINAIGWMCEHESSIAIHPKVITEVGILITSSQVNILTIVLTAVLPVLIMVAGVVIWIRRRRR